MQSTEQNEQSGKDFIRTRIEEDLHSGKHPSVVTRFPPEPNGYLHIGHAKSICLNFGVAKEYKGKCHLRFDDTNPETEEQRYMDSIQESIRWLGFDWGENLFHASDYFEKLYVYAQTLIRKSLAYVCAQDDEEIRRTRGTVKEAGTLSPYRNRSVEENLDLFERMKNGEFKDGQYVLRAKIDMANPNMKMRDPLLYRIRHAEHPRTGGTWKIYPMYDFAHCLSDSIEGITHSLCTLEFENNRELYDWILDALQVPCHPQQIEFARLNLTYSVMSKRKFHALIDEKLVQGWDDPRMPTLDGIRRRGVRPEAIRSFCEQIGMSKANSTVEMQFFEHVVRDDLNAIAPRRLAVMDPLKVVLTNWPENQRELLSAPSFPADIGKEGSREMPLTREVYIEKTDFMDNPPPKYYRLAPGQEVRLRHAYVIKCNDVIRNESGDAVELHCSVDFATLGKNPEGRKVKGTIHWVSASEGMQAELRLYSTLFKDEFPGQSKEESLTEQLNAESLTICNAWVEPALAEALPESHFQFERQGYFVADRLDHQKDKLCFNRTVQLKDSWGKEQKKS